MNEHDSERIAGLLEADGLVPAGEGDVADVIVLNTCCIRENADNRLYGTLGHLKSLKAERPEVEISEKIRQAVGIDDVAESDSEDDAVDLTEDDELTAKADAEG